jgi:hypothetical protein
VLVACFALQMAVSLGLAFANRDQWNGYRAFASSLHEKDQFKDRRVWINSEMGLRFYAESFGGLPMLRGQAVRPGDVVIASALAHPIPFTTGGGAVAPLATREIRSALPFQLFSLDRSSAWSLASEGFRPFALAATPIDIVRAETVTAIAPSLSYLPMNAPAVANQVISGVHQLDDPNNTWRWTTGRVVVLLKSPERPSIVEATFRVPDQVLGSRISLSVDGAPAVSEAYKASELFSLRTSPVQTGAPTATVTLTVDRVFRVAGDQRELGLILTGIGFRPLP